VGLFCPRNIYVDSSVGGNVHHRFPQARVAGNVRAVGIESLFREEFWRPWIGCWGLTVEGRDPLNMMGGEDGYVFQIKEPLGRGVSSVRMSGLKCVG
jgi:hypothetical protein